MARCYRDIDCHKGKEMSRKEWIGIEISSKIYIVNVMILFIYFCNFLYFFYLYKTKHTFP